MSMARWPSGVHFGFGCPKLLGLGVSELDVGSTEAFVGEAHFETKRSGQGGLTPQKSHRELQPKCPTDFGWRCSQLRVSNP